MGCTSTKQIKRGNRRRTTRPNLGIRQDGISLAIGGASVNVMWDRTPVLSRWRNGSEVLSHIAEIDSMPKGEGE